MKEVTFLNCDKHKIICAWCQKILVEGLEPISHGICDPCRDEVIKELKGKG